MLVAYGGSCACCGETESVFLTIDHIGEDGGGRNRYRDGPFRSSDQFYGWLIKASFPPEFRLLCFNCNSGRHINGGTCPHEESA